MPWTKQDYLEARKEVESMGIDPDQHRPSAPAASEHRNISPQSGSSSTPTYSFPPHGKLKARFSVSGRFPMWSWSPLILSSKSVSAIFPYPINTAVSPRFWSPFVSSSSAAPRCSRPRRHCPKRTSMSLQPQSLPAQLFWSPATARTLAYGTAAAFSELESNHPQVFPPCSKKSDRPASAPSLHNHLRNGPSSRLI